MSCKGNCCDPVALRMSPQELSEAYICTKTGVKQVKNPEDVEKMFRLFNFKGVSTLSPHQKAKYADGQVVYLYECKNFDYETRKCIDYENRPTMCRDYGNCGTCSYDGCDQ